MMPVSDEELAEKVERNARLREDIKKARAKRQDNVSQVANEVKAARLDAESAQLEAELAREQQGTKINDIRQGAVSTLGAARAQMEAAAAAAASQEAAAEAERARQEAAAAAEKERQEAEAKAKADAEAKAKSGEGK